LGVVNLLCVIGDTLLLTFWSLVIDVYNRQIFYVIQDIVGNNNNSIINCIFYLTKKSNQPEDGS